MYESQINFARINWRSLARFYMIKSDLSKIRSNFIKVYPKTLIVLFFQLSRFLVVFIVVAEPSYVFTGDIGL